MKQKLDREQYMYIYIIGKHVNTSVFTCRKNEADCNSVIVCGSCPDLIRLSNS